MNYEDFINHEARLARIDGCTGVTNLRAFCCKVHDLEYRYRVDSVSAYNLYKAGVVNYWEEAKPIDRRTADSYFRKCLQANSPLGYFSPLPYIRWIGVRLFGRWK